MNAFERNEKALDILSKGKFLQAQQLFFENARMAPSHETYNNLGWYLFTEGLECKNGKVRNAEKLGTYYLQKAESIRHTSVNLNNIAYVMEIQRNLAYCQTGVESRDICRAAYEYTEKALQLKYSNEAEYNRLRFLYLCDSRSTEVLSGLEKLSGQFDEPDCIEFLLNVLCIHARLHECLERLAQYRDKLDELCLMSLYCICGEYEKGAGLCGRIYEKYALRPVDIAMLADCLIRSGQPEKALTLKQAWQEDAAPETKKAAQAFCREADRIFDSAAYRAELIQGYRFRPPVIPLCGYFGCKRHGTPAVEEH